MQSYLPSKFLQEKINSLQTALFYSMSASVVKFPVSVINVLKVDEAGCIWFCLPAPIQSVKEFEDGFHSLLQFFKKGRNYYIKISGLAFIVNAPEDVNNISFVDDETKRSIILGVTAMIRVQVRCADYFESRLPSKKPELKDIPVHLYNLLFKPYISAHKPKRILNLSY